jgi:hypothetical protein
MITRMKEPLTACVLTAVESAYAILRINIQERDSLLIKLYWEKEIESERL